MLGAPAASIAARSDGFSQPAMAGPIAVEIAKRPNEA
jgi:hypothetical protein